MKFLPILSVVLAALSVGCTKTAQTITPLDSVGYALANGKYAQAQAIADELMQPQAFDTMGVRSLTGLSLALMQLSEHSNEPEANTAMAARCVKKAFELNADSVWAVFEALTVEDQACIVALNALNEACHDAPVEEEDSIYHL